MADVQLDLRFDQVQAEVLALLHRDMAALGGFLVSHMQQYAPEDTGNLKLSMADQYDPSTFTLYISIGMPYAVYPEFGTRFMTPHPYIRPTIIDAAAAYPWIDWDVLLNLNPPAQISEPLIATTSGFRVPRHQKLTAKQLAHVNKSLRPTSKRFAKAYKKAGVRFMVVGPKRRKP
jgi:HK97 gp10 family phage protein